MKYQITNMGASGEDYIEDVCPKNLESVVAYLQKVEKDALKTGKSVWLDICITPDVKAVKKIS